MTTWPVQTDTSTGGLGVAGTTQQVANTFIPKLWSDEILRSREKKLVGINFFKRVNHKGKQGDTIIIPFISNLTTHIKVPGEPVTLQTGKEGAISIVLDTHREVSKMFDKILEMQSRYDLRGEYTEKAGYALAKDAETDLFALFPANLPAAYQVIGSDGITAYSSAGSGNGTDLTDAGIRRMKQTLDDNDVPQEDRALFVPPSQQNVLLGIDKFTLFHNINSETPLKSGDFGTIYGFTVKVSTNLPTLTAADTTTTYKACIMAHKDAVCTAMQQDVATDSQWKLEYKGTLVVSDMVYGVKALRVSADDVSASNHRLSHAVMAVVPN